MSAAAIRAKADTAFADIGTNIGLALAGAAAMAVAEHQKRLNVSNPRPHITPSVKGEYPRKRTGFGQANVFYVPTSPAEIAKLGYVDCGYGENAFYMQLLRDAGARKGFEDTIEEMRPQLEQLIARIAARGNR